jgi:hypothetical protein
MPVSTQDSRETSSKQEVIYNDDERRSGAERRHATRANTVAAATLTGGSSLELIGGGAAVILSIIGLTGYLPIYMTSIATIAIGGALLAHGAAVTARVVGAVQHLEADRVTRIELGAGLGSEIFGGACGIALGILALAGVMPFTLLSVAAIVFGGAIMLGAPAQNDLARLAPDRDRRVGRLTFEAVEASMGAMVLAGVSSIVLGILAVIHVGPALTLVMCSMLAVGGALFLGGSAMTARLVRRLQQIA